MKSYIKSQQDVVSFFKEYILLFKSLKKRSAAAKGEVKEIIANYDEIASLIGRDLTNCDLLEIGVGQMPLRFAYFTSKARSAVGVDLDVIAVKYDLIEFFRMIKFNGFTRTIRTFGRQVLGLNANLMREFCAQMGFKKIPALNVVQADICAGTKLKASSFDVIVSTNVFEHLAEPSKALEEMARLVRPGGVVLTITCHWGQSNAIHDLEVMYGVKPARWAHLRPNLKHEVKQHAYVNELRIGDWKTLFSKFFDETTVAGVPSVDAQKLQRELAIARQNGELEGFSDEELLSETCTIRSIGRSNR